MHKLTAPTDDTLRAAVNVEAHDSAAAPWPKAGEGIATGRGADMLGTTIAAQIAAADIVAD